MHTSLYESSLKLSQIILNCHLWTLLSKSKSLILTCDGLLWGTVFVKGILKKQILSNYEIKLLFFLNHDSYLNAWSELHDILLSKVLFQGCHLVYYKCQSNFE